jgi:hypothetical protein
MICPYCKNSIRQKDIFCDGYDTQYFLNVSKKSKRVILSELNGNLILLTNLKIG